MLQLDCLTAFNKVSLFETGFTSCSLLANDAVLKDFGHLLLSLNTVETLSDLLILVFELMIQVTIVQSTSTHSSLVKNIIVNDHRESEKLGLVHG